MSNAFAIQAKGFTFAYPAEPFSEGASPNSMERTPAERTPLEGTGAFALGPLDWEVPEGVFALLVGATGSGKTTLLRSLKPAIAPAGTAAGQLLVFGQPVDKLSPMEATTQVGYVFQNPENQLVCDTVWHELAFGLENIAMEPAAMRRRVAEVAHFFGIEPWLHMPVSTLSGGQRQIVALAAALALAPRVLLLDEPTAQLDPVAEKTFLHALFRVNRELGTTVVAATHAPEAMAPYATCAYRLEANALEPVPVNALKAEALEVEGVAASSIPTGERALELRDVFVRYAKGAPWVLRGCDFAVQKSSVHALVGGNGCGKSTLLKVAASVLKCERGLVRNALAASQVLMPQNPKELFVCDTVDEELREWQRSAGYSDAAIDKMLNRFDLAKRRGLHPYDLSGGEQQLLALAKLLLVRPQLLLLDEPSKGLDAQVKTLLAQGLLEARAAGATIVIASHDLPFVSCVADRVTMLFDGQDAATEETARYFAGNLFYRPQADAFARGWLARNSDGGEGAGREGDMPQKSMATQEDVAPHKGEGRL